MSEMAAAVLDEELQEDEEVLILDDLSAELEIQKIKDAEEQCERSCAWYEEMIRRAQAKRDRIRETAERNLRSYFDMPGLPRKAAKTQVSTLLNLRMEQTSSSGLSGQSRATTTSASRMAH